MEETRLERDGAIPAAGHEISDLPPRGIVLFAIGMLIAAGLSVIVTSLLIYTRASRQARHEIPPPRLAREREVTAQPRLEIDAPQQLRELREGEERTLHSYGWVDKDGGIVRIPVERAMEMLAEKEGMRRQASGVRAKEEKAVGGTKSERGKQ